MTEPGANVVDEGGYMDQLMTVTGKADGQHLKRLSLKVQRFFLQLSVSEQA